MGFCRKKIYKEEEEKVEEEEAEKEEKKGFVSARPHMLQTLVFTTRLSH